MSITTGFEERAWKEPPFEDRYSYHDVKQLLSHTRALEAMLEWALDTISDEHGEEFASRPICEKLAEARKVLE